MNFDELKKQWDNQSGDEVQINPDLEKLKSANNILEELRKQIKNEFYLVAVSILFLFFIPIVPMYKISGITTVFYYFLVFYMLLGTVINYVRFFHFIKVTKEYEVNSSRDMLMKVYYELKYALDTYIVTTIVATPSGIGLYFILFSFGNSENYFNQLVNFSETYQSNLMFFVWILLLIICSILLIGAILYFMYVKYYGKRLKQIKQILDDLEE